MHKSELTEAVATSTGMSKSDSVKAIDAVFASITFALKQGEEVRLIGFGTFTTVRRPARTGCNPRTGETVVIPAATLPKFKAGKGLKDAVN